MKSSTLLTVATMVLAAGAASLSAEAINPPTTPQTAPMNKQEKKNLDMVLEWWRVVIQNRDLDATSKYQAEDYIQHNPAVNTGRAGFVAFFGKLPKPNIADPSKLANQPVVKGAKGDYVWLIWETEQKDPRDPSKTYHSNSFDVLRIQNGKVQEHWDSAMKFPGSGNVNTGVSPKPPMEWNAGAAKMSKVEKETDALATEELKDMLQYGHLELADKTMDPGYIQHNPNVPQGRDGFKAFMSRIPGRGPMMQADQAGMAEPARADADRRAVFGDDVGPHGEGSRRPEQDVQVGITTTWFAWRTAILRNIGTKR